MLVGRVIVFPLFKLYGRVMLARAEQPSSICVKVVQLTRLKLPIFRLVSDNSLNIPCIVVTLLVSKLLTSRLVREEQLWNIPYISVTLLVLKLLTSRLVREEQSQNILYILVTLLVSKLLMSRLVRDEQ